MNLSNEEISIISNHCDGLANISNELAVIHERIKAFLHPVVEVVVEPVVEAPVEVAPIDEAPIDAPEVII